MKSASLKHLVALLLLLCSVALSTVAAPSFEYVLSMPEPHTHYFEVELTIQDLKQPHIDLKLPVWAPGSYLVREFAKSVEGFEATAGKNQKLNFEKTDKSTWRVHSNNAGNVVVRYRVYAFELTVRTSYIDASHGYLNGTSVFMYADGHINSPYQLTVMPYQGWNQVSTGLTKTNTKGKWEYRAENYDVLADSPIEIGTHKVLQFEAAGIPHYVAMYGEGNYDDEKLLRDMKKVVEECNRVVGENPCRNYTFIVHNLPNGGGGLEHLNSTTLQTSRWGYQPESSYNGFLSLVAHEYFHLWNVKRIRPAALGPFDYSKENYTTALWFSEGVTSYYDDLLVRRAGFYTPERYQDIIASSIAALENTPGTKVQSAAEASWDAWIKFYRRNENSNNAEVSYYSKGAILGALLDLEIRNSTQNQKNFDDVMRYLWAEYYQNQNRGYTDAELKQAFEKVAGKSLDQFFQNYVYGTVTPDYNTFLGYAGLKLTNTAATSNDPVFGASTSAASGKLLVTGVVRGTAAYTGGISVNDELVAFNNYRISNPDELTKFIQMRKPGDKVKITISRDGRLQTMDITLGKNQNLRYVMEKLPNPTALQQEILKAWLKL